jgi:hypothetical protein
MIQELTGSAADWNLHGVVPLTSEKSHLAQLLQDLAPGVKAAQALNKLSQKNCPGMDFINSNFGRNL